jgi:LuxR family transcriptional regulator, maltose regulon positive regulatory protein
VSPPAAGTDLTEREFDVLRLLEKGLSKREIGQTLFLSYNTIHTHARSIYRKLGASSREEAIAQARGRGLI